MNRPPISKFEKEVFQSLKRLYPSKAIVSQYKIPFQGHKYDIAFPDDKVIVECYGNYWHSHKSVFSENRLHPTIGKPIKQLISLDVLREQLAKNQGYKVVIIWESEWKLKREILLLNLFS